MGGCIEDAVRIKTGREFFDHLKCAIDQEGLGSKVAELGFIPARQPVGPADDETKWFFKQRKCIEARPALTEWTGDRQFDNARSQAFGDLAARAATQLQLEAREGPRQLPQHWCEGPEGHRMRDRHREWRGLTLPDRCGRHLGRKGCFVTLAQHREHALAKFRQVRQCALAPKQLATEFGFEGLDGSAQSRL